VSWPLGILDWSAHLQLSSLVWSGANHIVRGPCTWRPPYFAEKFLNGKRDQGDWKLGASLGGLAFVVGQGVPGRDLVTEK